MALTTDEIDEIGFRLGYSPFLAQQTIEPAAAELGTFGEAYVRLMLADLDTIETAIRENYSQSAAITEAASAKLQPFGQLNLLRSEAGLITKEIAGALGIKVIRSRYVGPN